MKIQQVVAVGQAIFEVNREGLEVVVSIDSRLNREQTYASAVLSMSEPEKLQFCEIMQGESDLFTVEKLGKPLAVPNMNP